MLLLGIPHPPRECLGVWRVIWVNIGTASTERRGNSTPDLCNIRWNLNEPALGCVVCLFVTRNYRILGPRTYSVPSPWSPSKGGGLCIKCCHKPNKHDDISVFHTGNMMCLTVKRWKHKNSPTLQPQVWRAIKTTTEIDDNQPKAKERYLMEWFLFWLLISIEEPSSYDMNHQNYLFATCKYKLKEHNTMHMIKPRP